ncbi:MAG TPA: threonine synthase [Saprospiraceae bacterium]|nr:threonine synthase [Saprospiraceae bacterium]HMQ85303.1 threonine synthase [Saprospiraceae bacterium]
MKLYSTKTKNHLVELQEAVLKGLPDDNGLYMPVEIPELDSRFLKSLRDYSFQEIAFQVSLNLLRGALPAAELRPLIAEAMTFPAPLVQLNDKQYILELFHGPSLAFKDFGARFMAQLMSYFNRNASKELVILVATSGDTGGAVAAGFYKTPGIKVVILYPSGKVSPLQEKQLTTLGHNISAIEVQGTFDDCQALVKQAFLDKDLNQAIRLSSANSINIARLIPQSFYYFEAYKYLPEQDFYNKQQTVFCVPSGNFGNLTAGLIAQKMGLPIDHFIAATNVNDVVPEYLSTGHYNPRPSIPTLSNAMDVGNPSNFARMLEFYEGTDKGSTWNNMKNNISAYAFSDADTSQTLKKVWNKHQYLMDPHTSVGYLALEAYQKTHPNSRGIILSTAHPAKFLESVERILEQKIEIPKQLADLIPLEKQSTLLPVDYTALKDWLINNYK